MNSDRSRILLLIETPDLGGILALALRDYDVELHATADSARDAFRRRGFGLALVDLSGDNRSARQALIGEWKQAAADMAVILLSDLAEPGLSIAALEAGADDYLRKPFHHVELLVRIRKQLVRPQGWGAAAPMRRAGGVFLGSKPFAFGRATITPDLQARFPDGASERLLPKQLGILRLFAERAGQLVLRDDLAREVWGSDAAGVGHSVDEYVSTIRRLFRRHQVDFNLLVTSETKVGWRIAAAAAPAKR